jgi:L-fuculose-phosphate aldolase
MLEKEKREILHWGRQLLAGGLVRGTGGNLSVIDTSRTRVVITPSAVPYDSMQASDLVVCDQLGNVVEGRWKPSSEMNIHLGLYARRPDVGAVVHTHSVYATTLACLHREIPAVHYLVGFAGRKVPLAPYATFGTMALAENVAQTIGDVNAVLLANHGLVAVGPDLEQAFNTADQIEFVARIYYQTLTVEDPKILADEQMTEVLQKFANYTRQESSG